MAENLKVETSLKFIQVELFMLTPEQTEARKGSVISQKQQSDLNGSNPRAPSF